MKRILLGATCAVALSAGAAVAEPNGYVGGAWSQTNIEVMGSEADINSWSGEGKFVMPVGGLGLQLDGNIASYDFEELGLDDVTVFSPTAHLFARSDAGLIGGFAGWQHAEDVDFWGVGAEAEAYLDRFTVGGSLGWGTIDDADTDVLSGTAQARVFVTDNLRLDGGLGLMKLDAGGSDTDLWSASVGGEWKLDNAPVSFTASYEHSELDDFDLDADTFRLGVRLNFGSGAAVGGSSLMATGMSGGDTLINRDRSGPSLGSVSDRFGGALGQSVIGLSSAFFDLFDDEEGEGGEEGEEGEGGEQGG